MAVQEEWRQIIGFENYLVSSLGKIKRKESYFVSTNGRVRKFGERMLGGCLNKGYHFVGLQKTGDCRKYPVHRLVATAFIKNPNNSPVVNHKNGVKTDNRVENLEWATYSENALHSSRVLMQNPSAHRNIPVICINNNTRYESGRVAAAALNVGFGNLSKVLKGKYQHTKGFKFKYA